jgi:hypothetical protein
MGTWLKYIHSMEKIKNLKPEETFLAFFLAHRSIGAKFYQDWLPICPSYHSYWVATYCVPSTTMHRDTPLCSLLNRRAHHWLRGILRTSWTPPADT